MSNFNRLLHSASKTRSLNSDISEPYLFGCKLRLVKTFFHHFVRLTIEGGVHFFLAYRKVYMTPSLSLLTFCWPNSLFPLSFLA